MTGEPREKKDLGIRAQVLVQNLDQGLVQEKIGEINPTSTEWMIEAIATIVLSIVFM